MHPEEGYEGGLKKEEEKRVNHNLVILSEEKKCILRTPLVK